MSEEIINKEENIEKQNEKAVENKIDVEKKNWPRMIIWSIIGLIVFVLLVQISVADKYSAQVLVIDGDKKVGVNPTTEKLDFGDMSRDTSSARFITLESGGMDTFVYVLKFGSIAELIDLSENGFVMKEGDKKKLEFSLYMPPSAPIDEMFTGRVWIFKLPKLF